jgi:hypothetical protein
MRTGYDIDALLSVAGSAYDKIHPVYVALSNVFDRTDLTNDELPFHDAQFFRDYLAMSGFPRFCEPEYVAEFALALNGFQKMEISCLERFCKSARAVLKDSGLLDHEENPVEDLDMDYEDSVTIGEGLSDQFYVLVTSSEVDEELLRYLRSVAPRLRERMTAEYLWIWEPDVEKGYGGKSKTIPNPKMS